MFDPTTRLFVAYGLIAFMLLAGLAIVLWKMHNSRPRRDARARTRLHDHYRKRDEAAVEQATAER